MLCTKNYDSISFFTLTFTSSICFLSSHFKTLIWRFVIFNTLLSNLITWVGLGKVVRRTRIISSPSSGYCPSTFIILTSLLILTTGLLSSFLGLYPSLNLLQIDINFIILTCSSILVSGSNWKEISCFKKQMTIILTASKFFGLLSIIPLGTYSAFMILKAWMFSLIDSSMTSFFLISLSSRRLISYWPSFCFSSSSELKHLSLRVKPLTSSWKTRVGCTL